ncbi:MAG TPA: SRPBCC domain-containing protein [Anaerolineales bacterium]|nr:SRPBCC domain-containing protein [Anaerolineales bacterium]
MTFQNDPDVIRWKLHLKSSPQVVYQKLSTDEGRASFWAESAMEENGVIHFVFPNDAEWKGKILDKEPPHQFKVEYYGGSITTFELHPDDVGGTDLTLADQGVHPEDRTEVIAGWISVLMALKAYVDFGVDLRTHDRSRTWDEGYAEN